MKISNIIAKANTAYAREIELQPQRRVGFFMTLGLLITTAFGFFGLRPQVLFLFQQKKYEKELSSINKILENKAKTLELSKQDLELVEPMKNSLFVYMPENDDLQSYLSQLIKVVAKTGYILKNFKQDSQDVDKVKLSIELEGNITNLYELIKGVESLKRITQINTVQLNTSEKDTLVNLKLTIYKIT